METLFSTYGECDIRLLMDRERGTPKGIAFVEYWTVREMKAAIGKLRNETICFLILREIMKMQYLFLLSYLSKRTF
jgi:RNA recognition motif-containing protein